VNLGLPCQLPFLQCPIRICNWELLQQVVAQGTQSHFSSVLIEHENKKINSDIDKREKKGDEINVKVRGNVFVIKNNESTV
jgi:hypothetical protein